MSDTLHRLYDGGPEHLLRQSPVTGSRPAREVARRPRGGSDHKRILGPALWVLGIHRDGDVETATHSTQPPPLGPVRESPGGYLSVDPQLSCHICGRYEPPPAGHRSELGTTSTRDSMTRHQHTVSLIVDESIGLMIPHERQ